jgi:hypothetical protein
MFDKEFVRYFHLKIRWKEKLEDKLQFLIDYTLPKIWVEIKDIEIEWTDDDFYKIFWLDDVFYKITFVQTEEPNFEFTFDFWDFF